MENKIRIFNYPWHIAHQYELMKLPNTKWSWLAQHRRSYSAFPRDDFFEKFGGEWVPHYESGKYDIALLHLDQQCFEDGIWDRGKGSLYEQVNRVITDIPKVCIMHGTPFYPENFESDITEENYQTLGYSKDQIGMSSVLIEKFKEAVKDIDALIFNSHTAGRQWGYPDGEYVSSTGKKQIAKSIWHGLDPNEWYDLPKEPRVITMISPGGLDMYYDRTLLRAVKEMLAERNIEHCHVTVDVQFKSWEEYRQFIGRSLIYFNPTRESPMPRSRTEAMYSGACVLSIKGQDAEEFIETGVNGIIVPRNPEKIVELIEGLLYDYKTAVEMGQKGKQTALEKFDYRRYQQDWLDVLNRIVKK